jgi:hypothetical protein
LLYLILIDLNSTVANEMALASKNEGSHIPLASQHLPSLSSISSTSANPQSFRSPPKQQQGHANAAALQSALNGALQPTNHLQATFADELIAMKAEITGMK